MKTRTEEYALAMNFGWLEDCRLAGCRGPRSDRDLRFLFSMGIRALVRLAHEEETGITEHDVQQNGLQDCYEPVRDFTPPNQGQIDRVVGFIFHAIEEGKAVAVSCGAGCGRTGTILACYLVSLGRTAEEAIEELLSKRPVSREVLRVPGQKEAVEAFRRRLEGASESGR